MEIKQWSTDNCRNIIEQIRREQYLIGVELPVEAAKGAESLRNKLNNALKLLAEDLYSKETHFVLELVQNADDNVYPDRSKPTIGFNLQQNCIVIINNEMGFEEPNVYALCSVGESTKKKRAGFIGEKGIGFKSVFTVSDRPEIHSNGFHFRFDRTDHDQLLGYVVPHWCDDNAKLFSETETTIVLPAKKDSTFSTEVLAEVSDELLLFLRKIRRIDIETDNGSRQRCFERTDQGNIVSLSSRDKAAEESVRRFVHAAHVFSIAGIVEEKRPTSSESEIVLAFPVGEDGKAIADSTHPVFAFLPIRDFGFRFLVQGDFLLSSGREDIQKARPWNIKCRDEIAEAFIQTLDFFKSSESLAYTFLNFVPRRSEVPDPFFRTAAESIVQKLSQQPCIQGVSGVWRKPTEALLADEQIRTLIPHPAALRLFGKDYASPRIDAAKEVLSLLGCVSLSLQHVIKVFEDATWVKEQGPKWIAQFYAYLADKFTTDKEIAKLKEASCLLLDGGALVSPAKEEVFFPLEHRRKYGFESELKLIDDDILEAIPAFSEDIRRFLTKLGVKIPDPYSLITNHILPLHSKEDWKQSRALTGHVRYIKDRLKDYLDGASSKGQAQAKALSVLANGLWLQTKKVDSEGLRWFRRATALYVSHEYEPGFDIEGLLGEESDPVEFISTDYLSPKMRNDLGNNENAAAKAAWREFFLGIGVLDIPRVSAGVADHEPSKELELLLKAEDSKVRRQTIEMIDRRWSYYSAYVKKGSVGNRASRFGESLRATVAPTKKKKAVPLSATYVDSDAIRAVFGDSPVYLDAHVSNPAFLDACEIVHNVDLVACLKRLDHFRTNEKPRLPTVQRIYRHIEQIFEKDQQRTRQAFHEVPRIFVPGKTPQWATVKEVTWTTHGALLDSLFPPLEHHYREHLRFFCHRIGVARELPVTALIGALRKLPDFEESAEERRSDALKIYKRLARELDERTDPGEPDWIETFRSEALFLDHMGRLVLPDSDLYVDDSRQLSQLFCEREQISFLAVDWPQIPQIQTLLDVVGIPRLSEKTTYQRVPSEAGETELEQGTIIKTRYHIIARVVYAMTSHVAFKRATENGAWGLLSSIQVKQVPTLSLEVSLGTETAISQWDIFRQGNIIFVRAGASSVTDRLSQEICLLLNVKTSLSDTIYRIISARDESELSEFFEVRGIQEVPEEELLKIKLQSLEGTVGRAQTKQMSDPKVSFEDISGTNDHDEGSVGTLEVGEEINAAIDTSTSNVRATYKHDGGEKSSTDRDPSIIISDRPAAVTEEWESKEGAEEIRSPNSARRSKDKARSGRLLSYAESPRDPNKQSSAVDDAKKAAERMKVARAAVDFVLEIGLAEKQDLVEMAPNNKGFDIKRVLGDGTEEFIEVKGQRGGWTETGVALTPDELRSAEKYRDHYWLYVVEFAKDVDRRVLHKIQDPFGSTTEFRFDCGWKGLAVTFSNEGLKPATGLKIDIPNVGPGVILSAENRGELYKLHVQLDEGQKIFRVYDPGKMRLYRDN